MHIIPIASGKGGVGKSMISANLSIALAEAGKEVILADMDLGASNLHVILGSTQPRRGIGNFLSGSSTDIASVIYETDINNLYFIPGDAEIPGLANITQRQKNQLTKKLLGLSCDYLVLDLGAGSNINILDYFLLSNRGIVVSAPMLTATLNAYLFVKNIVFRLMWESCAPKSTGRIYLESLKKEGTVLQKAQVPELITQLRIRDTASYELLKSRLDRFRPRLIMNMLEDPKDADRAQKIRRSCQDFLGIDLEHLGIIYRDDFQNIALNSRIPVIRYKPQSILAQAMYRIADKIISTENEEEAPIFGDEYYNDTYDVASTEAAMDFESKIDYVEELLSSGALTQGELIETIKLQQYEIHQLRKENQFFKYKITQAASQGFKV